MFCHRQAPGERMGTRFWSPQLVSAISGRERKKRLLGVVVALLCIRRANRQFSASGEYQ